MLHRATLVCLQETMLEVVPASWATELLGTMFDYVFVPSVGAAGGVLLAWRRDVWEASLPTALTHSISVKLKCTGSHDAWWLTAVYGPQSDKAKREFLAELRSFREANDGPWLICGDFNMIYQAADKNNDRLDRRGMRRFRSFIDFMLLQELLLTGRRYTWSNGQDVPTLERLDRALATAEWHGIYPYHCLMALSSDCSDHCPILQILDTSPGAKRRFRFESFWVKLPGFLETVEWAWQYTPPNADPCRVLDYKLRNVARALKSWSASQVGSVRLCLAIAREVVLRLEEAQEFRALSMRELELRKSLKLKILGLASLA